jgi:hypothetical protein
MPTAAGFGRRESRAIGVLARYIAALCTHTDTLVPGETGLVLIIAPDQRQALIVLEYIAAAFAATPILSQLVASRTADTLTLTNRVSIEVRSASFRRLRGPTYLAAHVIPLSGVSGLPPRAELPQRHDLALVILDTVPWGTGLDGIGDEARCQMPIMLLNHPGIGVPEVLRHYQQRRAVPFVTARLAQVWRRM